MIALLWACNGVTIDGPVDTGSGERPVDSGQHTSTDTGSVSDTSTDTSGGDTSDSGGSGVDTSSPYSCDALPESPLSYTSTSGWSGAEDFTFDGEGYLVSVDQGSLTRRNRAGDEIVVRPGLGETAGITMLPTGTDAVYASVSGGSVVRISLENGGSESLLGGLAYPNGVDVDADGWVYVAEHSGGRVHRVHMDTGESEVLATGMTAPNGVAFGPDEQTLYWGSFGDGSIHAVDREGDGFGEPYLFGYTPESSTYWGALSDPCHGSTTGDGCYSASGGIGTCAEIGDQLACELVDSSAACKGLAAGDACSHELLGETVHSLCVEGGPPVAPVLSCGSVPAEELEACSGLAAGDACDGGECLETWDDALVCGTFDDEVALRAAACDGAEEHTVCQVESSVSPYVGVCQEGPTGMSCAAKPSGYGSHGGLDGLNVDRCGNVYVTEYVYGYIFKIAPEGGVGAFMVDLPSSWIPNMHWGNGVGDWEEDVLYVMDRNDGGWGGGGSELYEVAVEIEGVTQAYEP